MNKKNSLNLNKYISLGFFRCESNAYQNSLIINPFSCIDNRDPAALGIEYRNLLSWGYSDVISIFTFSDPEKVMEFQKMYPRNNKIYEDRYNFGVIIEPGDFNLSKIDDFPLVGISFIKFDDKLFKSVKNEHLLKLIKEYIGAKVKNLTTDKEILPVLIFSYGWEDIILLIFAKRYDVTKELIFKLRADLQYPKITSYLDPNFSTQFPKARHIITATYTTFATYLNPKGAGDNFDKLLSRVDSKDKTLVEQINFQIRPGHLDWVITEIKKRYTKATFQFLPGRQDLSLKLKNMKVRDLFDFYFNTIWPIISLEGNPIISTQTFFALNDNEEIMEENTACKNSIEIHPLPEVKRLFIENTIIDPTYLPYHSAIALGNILVAAWYLENNFFIKGIMRSLIKFIEVMGERIKNNNARFDIAVERILPLLSLCYIDRFRGSYPLGESFATPLITCKGSIQKQLLLVDNACFIIFSAIKECLNAQGKNIEPHFFCSTIGTTTSPAVASFNSQNFNYNLAIVQIPVDSIFTPKDLYYLFHEMGHVVVKYLKLDATVLPIIYSFALANKLFDLDIQSFDKIDNGIDKILIMHELLEEILCDYILLTFGFEGDLEGFSEFMSYYDQKLTRGMISDEIIVRTSIVKILFPYLKDRERVYSEFQSLKADLKSYYDKYGPAKYEYVAATVDFIYQEISQKSEFLNFLENIKSFVETKGKNQFYLKLKQFPSFSLEKWIEIYRENY